RISMVAPERGNRRTVGLAGVSSDALVVLTAVSFLTCSAVVVPAEPRVSFDPSVCGNGTFTLGVRIRMSALGLLGNGPGKPAVVPRSRFSNALSLAGARSSKTGAIGQITTRLNSIVGAFTVSEGLLCVRNGTR